MEEKIRENISPSFSAISNKFIENEQLKIKRKIERRASKNSRALLARAASLGFQLDDTGKPISAGEFPLRKRYHYEDSEWWFQITPSEDTAAEFHVEVGTGDPEKEGVKRSYLPGEWLRIKKWSALKERLKGE